MPRSVSENNVATIEQNDDSVSCFNPEKFFSKQLGFLLFAFANRYSIMNVTPANVKAFQSKK